MCFKKKSVFSISRIDNCFNVFSKSEAFHGIIFQGKSFTITFCKPCKLFVNLWTYNFCSVRKCPMALNRCIVAIRSYDHLGFPLFKLQALSTTSSDKLFILSEHCCNKELWPLNVIIVLAHLTGTSDHLFEFYIFIWVYLIFKSVHYSYKELRPFKGSGHYW